MRVAIDADSNGEGWDVAIVVDGGEPFVHRMHRLPSPLLVAPSGSPDPEALDALQRSCARIASAVGTPTDLEHVGRHLFDALVGEEAWNAIRSRAEVRGVRLVELALRWPSADALNAVRWELMHDGGSFVVGSRTTCAFALSRVVTDAPEVDAELLETIDHDARILFAIGTELSDPDVHAGAEIMGLLRRMERGDAAITSRILEDASLARIEQAVASFAPHIVHLVSHGRRTADGGELLLRDDAHRGDDTYVGATRLMTALAAADRLPNMVVISACHTGTATAEPTSTDDYTTSLAAELVRMGVPVVVGMTGHVSDQACRLFIDGFGTALASGGRLIEAMAHGRRAAFFNEGGLSQRGDWALPTVFVSPLVGPDHVPLDAEIDRALLDRINHYEIPTEPVFCGRRGFFGLLARLLDPADRLNMVNAFTNPPIRGVGKSRLLQEVAESALRDGHVVVLVNDRLFGTDTDHPKDPWGIACVLLRGIVLAREAFRLEFPTQSPLIARLAQAAEVPSPLNGTSIPDRWAAYDRLVELRDVELSPREIGRYLTDELARLRDDVRGAHGVTDESRVILLLDEIDGWNVDVLMGLLGPFGLGTDDMPVPVMVTCSYNWHGDDLHDRQLEMRGQPWIKYAPLGRFDPFEAALATRWVLLNPRDREFVETEQVEEAGKVITAPPGGQVWWERLERTVRGVPEQLTTSDFYFHVGTLLHFEQLQEGDDAQVLREYLETLGP